jgi:hypothetical protein
VTPDAVALFETIELAQQGDDRVAVSGVRGAPAPAELKLAINYSGGYRNEMTLVLTGLDIEEKARVAMDSLKALWPEAGFDHLDVDLWRSGHPDPQRNEEACALLRVTVKDRDRDRAGRSFSDAFVQAALSSYPGFFLTSPPAAAHEFGVYWPALVPRTEIVARVTHWDGTVEEVVDLVREAGTPAVAAADEPMGAPRAPAMTASVPTAATPFGRLFGTRSGDKGGNANLGVWARSSEQYAWLQSYLTTERLAELLPDIAAFPIARYELPNLRALNFVVRGLLGDGVASATRFDRQAKGLGEYLGCKLVPVPMEWVETSK